MIDPFQVVSPFPVSGAEEEASVAAVPTLWANPNPNSAGVRLGFTCPAPGPVDLAIYAVDGRRIATIMERRVAAGPHEAVWDGGTAPSGAYFAVLRTPGRSVSARFVRLR